jgi:hypothetical protein
MLPPAEGVVVCLVRLARKGRCGRRTGEDESALIRSRLGVSLEEEEAVVKAVFRRRRKRG